MKAYVISDDEYCTIEFAEHRATAQASGANELNSEFQYVRCRRAPEFDQYAKAGKVPWKVLIEDHDWSQECGYCYNRVHSDEEDRVYNDGEDQVYCSTECMHKAKKYLEKVEAIK